MKSKTFTLSVAADPNEVFAYFANPETLPEWATDFCKSIRKDGEHWKVETDRGELFFKVTPDEQTGVVDMHAGPAPDLMAPMFVRIVESPGGGSSANFTFNKGPECTDEQFEIQCRSFKSELSALTEKFGGGSVGVSEFRPGAYTGLVVENPRASCDFYTKHLGFIPVFDSPDYVHLCHTRNSVELALMRSGECSQMKEFEKSTVGSGMWLGLDVTNADTEYDWLKQKGVEIVQPPTDQPWGERTFVVRDPDGVLVYLAHKIPVAESFKKEHGIAEPAAV